MVGIIKESISKLSSLKNQCVENLITKGVEANSAEGFNSLIPKILNVSSSTSYKIASTKIVSTAANMVRTITLPNKVLYVMIQIQGDPGYFYCARQKEDFSGLVYCIHSGYYTSNTNYQRSCWVNGSTINIRSRAANETHNIYYGYIEE